MAWQFELAAGPFEGQLGGVVWDGTAVLFAAIDEGKLMRLDPHTGAVDELRRYTNRVNGLARGPNGELYGAQEGGRRLVEFTPDGRMVATDALLDGKYHNQPSDLVVDRAHRIWFTDPHHAIAPYGPAIFPYLYHASVLRLQRDAMRAWTLTRITYDTCSPRAVLPSADEKTLYVADGLPREGHRRELRAYPVQDDGSVGPCLVLHTFGADRRGPQRGIEGLTRDPAGHLLACGGWKRSGPGPLIYVFDANGAVLATHPLPGDQPNKLCFGAGTLYVTTAEGRLYAARTA
jgi:gluconolactonase